MALYTTTGTTTVIPLPALTGEAATGDSPRADARAADNTAAAPLAMLTEQQAATYLGASLSTVRRRRRAGIGPDYFRVGNILRYSTAALDAFRERKTTRNQ